MISFKNHILLESYKNLIGNDPEKEKYADQVWDILQRSYASIGGIKGSGFKSKEDMIQNIPFWKLNVKNGKVVFVTMYKDKGGRKSVAFGTDGSPEGKKVVSDFLKVDVTRSYGEKSKAALGAMMKMFDWNVLKPYVVKPSNVSKILKVNRIIPVKSLRRDELPEDAQLTLKKYPQLIEYGYLRDIGDKMVFKVMIGTPGKTIS